MTDPDTGATRIITKGQRAVAERFRVYRLRVRAPDRAERVETVSAGDVRVGSAAKGNDLVVEDPTVSRFHFEILADERGFRLRDLGSTNGTFVDGFRALDVYLRPGATIAVGKVSIAFEPAQEEETEVPLPPEDSFGPLVGRSAAMRRVFSQLQRVAPADVTVLVEGESGTGKELAAQAIHARSPRAGGPFAVFDCAAAPAGTLESMLFGHERGAFTGATARHVGVLEAADGGTLFVDELGELPVELQPKLLRVLERREIRRLGGAEVVPVDFRVVAATNRDLAAEVNEGTFREDLYYRLAVVRLRLPPLRERREDVRPLAEHLLRQILRSDPARAEELLARIGEETWRRLEAQPWRGNVRELRNLLERMVVMSDPGGEDLSLRSLSEVSGPGEEGPGLEVDPDRPMVEQRTELVERFERAYITAVLDRHDGKIAPAARAAGVDRSYFKRLMRKRGV